MPDTRIYASQHPASTPTALHAEAYMRQQRAEPSEAMRTMAWSHFGSDVVLPVRPDNPAGRALINQVVDICITKKIRNVPEIYIIDSRVPNAASFNGEALVFTSRILETMSPDELSAIIGHELAHHRHFLRDAMAIPALAYGGAWAAHQLWLLGTSHLTKTPSVRSSLLNQAGTYLANYIGATLPIVPYRHFMEYESDREGAHATSPQQMIDALKTLDASKQRSPDDESQRSLGNRFVRILTYPFSTHPATERRIAALEKMAQPPVAGR